MEAQERSKGLARSAPLPACRQDQSQGSSGRWASHMPPSLICQHVHPTTHPPRPDEHGVRSSGVAQQHRQGTVGIPAHPDAEVLRLQASLDHPQGVGYSHGGHACPSRCQHVLYAGGHMVVLCTDQVPQLRVQLQVLQLHQCSFHSGLQMQMLSTHSLMHACWVAGQC